MSHTPQAAEDVERESLILSEIKDSEKKADEIIENAKLQKERILKEAMANSSKLLAAKEDEIRKLQEKKLMDFRDKSKLLYEERILEGKNAAKQLKSKSEKNVSKSVDFVLKKFEEMV